MKKEIVKITTSLLRNTGSICGSLLCLLPLNIRTQICATCAKWTHSSPRAIYFLVYSFLNGIVSSLSRVSDCGIFLFRKMNPGFTMELDITKKTQRQIYLSKVYEPHVTNYILRTLQKGDVFVDVGANVGYYTLMASILVGENGRVIAFEPEEENFMRLSKNIGLNNFANIIPVNKAIAEEDSEKILNINPFNEGGHSIEKFDSYRKNGVKWSVQKTKEKFPNINFEQKVHTVSLDSYLSRAAILGTPALVKIDVEGFELDVLKGMKDLLSLNKPPQIICEVSKSKEKIFSMLADYGYRVYLVDEFGNEKLSLEPLGKRDYLFKKE